MNIKESAVMLAYELERKGITEEYIIDTYGSVDNWTDSIVEGLKNTKKLG